MFHILKPNRDFQTRGYSRSSHRKSAIKMLAKRGWNYFVCFRDVQSEFALQMGHADWVESGYYVNL